MWINRLIYEDFINYKTPAMFIGCPKCNGKCWRDLNLSPTLCQNNELVDGVVTFEKDEDMIKSYMMNPMTKAIVFGGLEPFDSFSELYFFIEKLRKESKDDVVIYTGYYPSEIETWLQELKRFENIVVKFGRYIPNIEPVFDEVLGIKLASNNQWAERIS